MDRRVILDLLERNQGEIQFQRRAFRSANGQAIPGLIPTLKRRFYPSYALPLPPRAGASSSMEEGKFCDHLIHHACQCRILRRGDWCTCIAWTPRQLSALHCLQKVKYYFEDLSKQGFSLVASQYSVTNGSVATSIDDIAYDRSHHRLIVIERKCGFTRRLDVTPSRDPFLKAPLNQISNNIYSHHQLQAAGGRSLLKSKLGNVIPIHAFVCYMTPYFKHPNAKRGLVMSWHSVSFHDLVL